MCDFVTTSINDPDLLYYTYNSYNQYLKNINLKQCKLIINIDPIPNNSNIQKNIEVCKYFFKEVVYRIGTSPNFTKGNLWCLSNVKTEYFFYIQSNKSIQKEVDFNKMLNMFETNIVSIGLSPINLTGYSPYLNWHPNLWKTAWIKEKYLPIASNMVSSEYQLREIGLLEGVKAKLYIKDNNSKYFLQHIGKKWKHTHKYFFGNLSTDEEISNILNNEDWHLKIYNFYKNKSVNKDVFNNFSRKVYGNTDLIQNWKYRWTGVFGYGNNKNKMSRYLQKKSP